MAFDIYKRTEIGDATTYVRPFETVSLGPLNGLNTMVIQEEKIVVLPDLSTERVALDTPGLQVTISDPTASFNVVHPATGAVTGSMTFAQLKIQMYSMYLHFAAIRDAELAAAAAAAALLVAP